MKNCLCSIEEHLEWHESIAAGSEGAACAPPGVERKKNKHINKDRDYLNVSFHSSVTKQGWQDEKIQNLLKTGVKNMHCIF